MLFRSFEKCVKKIKMVYTNAVIFDTICLSLIHIWSMLPVLVPIISPSSGVRPIDVSMHLPYLTAVIEEPFPRWHVTILKMCIRDSLYDRRQN